MTFSAPLWTSGAFCVTIHSVILNVMKGSEEHGRYTFAARPSHMYTVLSSPLHFAVTGEGGRKGASTIAANL